MGLFDGIGEVTNSQTVKLDVGLRPQQTTMWCWAACCEMVLAYLGVEVTQCDQANKRLDKTTCCAVPIPGECVKGGWPEFDKYDFLFCRTHKAALSWEEIVEQISSDRTPFCYTRKARVGKGGHMLVVFGYSEVDGQRDLWVHDPAPMNEGKPGVIIPYEVYVSDEHYKHWDDFYHVRPKPASTQVGGGGPSA